MGDKPDYYYRQSAVIPYRQGADGLEVLLVTTRSGKRWIFPKGIVEEGLSPADSALKEAWEEAGVRGTLVSREAVGSYTYDKWGGTCTVLVFLMEVREVADSWPEPERKRFWTNFGEAARMIHPPSLSGMVERAPSLVKEHTP